MKTVKLSAWVTPAQRQSIKDRAARAGLSVSEYLTASALAARLDHHQALWQIYNQAGEAHTLASLTIERCLSSNVSDELTELLAVTEQMRLIIQQLLE